MTAWSRRAFVQHSGSCAAHLALAAAGLSRAARDAWARPALDARIVAREPFGSLERIDDGVWALISTPLGGDRTTLSNGGFVAGRSGVVAIEGFNQPAGATWLAERARALTGRWPTHVVLTHYHADHANGVSGFRAGGARPAVQVTARSRTDILARNLPADVERTAALADAVLVDGEHPTTIDLGDRVVRLTPSAGHTASDVWVQVEAPDVIFGGDLLWNGMFPNYVDALPSRLAPSVRALPRRAGTRYVPGHGPMADLAAVERYLAMLDEVERAARAFHREGRSAADAGASYRLPQSLGAWVLFNPSFFTRAFTAWYRELDGSAVERG